MKTQGQIPNQMRRCNNRHKLGLPGQTVAYGHPTYAL